MMQYINFQYQKNNNKKMHTNHLLKSLVSNASASRSNSPAFNSQLTGTFAFYPKSHSASKSNHKKHQNIQSDRQYIPLIKSILNLNVKIRQNYLFAFCKLEQLTKVMSKTHDKLDQNDDQSQNTNNKAMGKYEYGVSGISRDVKVDIQRDGNMASAFVAEEVDNVICGDDKDRVQQQWANNIRIDEDKMNIKKGIILLQDWIIMNQTKSNIYHTHTQLNKQYTSAFHKLRTQASKHKSISTLTLTIERLIKNKRQEAILTLQRYDTVKMRCQIMIINFNYLVNKKLAWAFSQVKNGYLFEGFNKRNNISLSKSISNSNSNSRIQVFQIIKKKSNIIATVATGTGASSQSEGSFMLDNSKISNISSTSNTNDYYANLCSSNTYNSQKQNTQRQQKTTIKQPIDKQQTNDLKRPKLVMKQKKLNINKPLTMNTKPLQAQKLRCSEDKHIEISIQINCQMRMGYPITLKPQYMVNCLPDLNDHCYIFRENPMEIIGMASQDSKLQIDTCSTDWKHMISQLNTSTHNSNIQCQTQRNHHSNASSRTCLFQTHHHTANKSKAQHSSSLYHGNSPLQKIDHILQKITHMKQFKVVMNPKKSQQYNIQKKKVNLNLNNKLQKAKYSSYNNSIENTPNKYLKNQKKHSVMYGPDDLKQFQKQNCRQRMITQKEKGLTPKASVQLQPESIVKYKSTNMMRSAKQKIEKSQLSTAKKMKLQIENIINRRNKQLMNRNQSMMLFK